MMTFPEAFFFFYCTLAVTAFTCQAVYFAAKGLQKHLADHKLVRDLRKDEAGWRDMIKGIER